jgi:hypothetical protein
LRDFEGVTQHQVLGFGVDEGFLPARRDPAAADFQLAIERVDLPEARRADDLAAIFQHDHERHHRAGITAIEGFFQVAVDGAC